MQKTNNVRADLGLCVIRVHHLINIPSSLQAVDNSSYLFNASKAPDAFSNVAHEAKLSFCTWLMKWSSTIMIGFIVIVRVSYGSVYITYTHNCELSYILKTSI